MCSFSVGDVHDANMKSFFYRLCLIAVMLCTFLHADNAASDSASYSREYANGSIKAKLSIDRTVLDFKESLTVVFEAEAPEDYSIEFAECPEASEQFLVKDSKISKEMLRDDNMLVRILTMKLEPLAIPDNVYLGSLTVSFVPSSKNGERQSISTDPVSLNVTMPDAEFWKKLDIDASASENYEKVNGYALWLVWGLIVLVLIMLALAVWLVYRWKHGKTAAEPQLPPHVIALAQLQDIMERKHIEKGEIMEFYNSVQNVLRQYIEARFNMHAPERTTEEFMDELRRAGNSSIAVHGSMLWKFLNHCDLVRFATLVPQEGEIKETFELCREFVEKTGTVDDENEVEEERHV